MTTKLTQTTINPLVIEWYLKGYNDEAKGTSSVVSEDYVLNIAYDLGVSDFQNGIYDTPADQKLISAIHNVMRQKSLSWWRSLLKDEQEFLAEKYYPNDLFVTVTTSSIRIDKIFKSENKIS